MTIEERGVFLQLKYKKKETKKNREFRRFNIYRNDLLELNVTML